MRLLLSRLFSRLPSPLPTGMQEFESWADSIIKLLPSGLDSVPVDDKKYVLAASIQHLKETQSLVPKNHFVRLLHKAAASQVAGQVFMNIKQKQLEQQERDKAEATAKTEVANVQAQNTQEPQS